MAYNVPETEAYIRQAAKARGIDPDIAVRVARSEGLARGVYQSNLSKGGTREPSYGPFQLLVGGEGTGYPVGLGNDFVNATGLDPRDPSTVNAQVDFALDRAAEGGWSPWYGAKAAGIGSRDGIGGEGSDTRELDMGGASMAGYPSNVGGLGGLGGMVVEEEPEQDGFVGFINNPGVADTLRAVGLSMMSSPRNNWLQDMGTYLPALQKQRLLQEAAERDQREKQQTRGAWSSALQLSGLSDEEAALMANSPDAAAYAIKARTANDEKNTTKAYLQNSYPDLYDEVQAGRPLADAMSEANERRKAGLKAPDLQEIYDEEGRVQKGYFKGDQWVPVGGAKGSGAGGGEYGLQPVPVLNADGTYGVVQLGKDGTINQPKFPEGVRPYNPGEISEVKARGTAAGKAGGEAVAALPGAEGTATRVSAQIESLKNDPYLSSMVGPLDSRRANWSGDAARVQSKMDQLQGGAFLEARNLLKGGGAITDFEGKKAEDAFARLNAAQSETDYIDALNDFDDAVQTGLEKLRQRANGGTQMPGVSGQPGGGGMRSKYGLE